MLTTRVHVVAGGLWAVGLWVCLLEYITDIESELG